MLTRYTPSDTPDEFIAIQRLADATVPPHRIRALLESVATPQEIFTLSNTALGSPPLSLTAKQIARLQEAGKAKLPGDLLAIAERLSICALTWRDATYPANLHPYNDAPALLFMRGALLPEDRLSIGVVGSRRATLYGRNQAVRFVQAFVEHKLTIISGGAAGIDTAAHRAALNVGGRTIAVLGCGVDISYPAENRQLFDEIAERGAVLSEFAFGTKPEPWHFPTRNRIIAGMSLATLVVEAPEGSGALITARNAGEYGRDVWAVPGAVDSNRSRGCHRLIQDGAGLADSPQDVLDALNVAMGQTLSLPLDERAAVVSVAEKPPTPPPKPAPAIPPIPLSTEEQKLLVQFGEEPRHLDEGVTAAGLSAAQGAVATTLLEMKSLLRRYPGNFYTRVQ